MVFKECTDIVSFLNKLPLEWQEDILPYWKQYEATTKGFLLLDNGEFAAGGLAFSKCPPDMLYALEEANNWFKNDYLYLGFIYVVEHRRKQNLGSAWLYNLKKECPKQKFWLVIEDPKLGAFYEKNDFKYVKTLKTIKGRSEMLYCFVP